MFFDDIPYPPQWNQISDEVLTRQYYKRCRRKPYDHKPQLIICYLMKKHKAGILLVSRRYMDDNLDIEDFVQDLYLKLVNVLKRKKVKKRFGGLLLTMVSNMHRDILREKKRKFHYDIEEAYDLADRDMIKRSVDLIMSFPLNHEKLDELHEQGVLSALECYMGKQLLDGSKPREIEALSTAADLGIENAKIHPDPERHRRQKIRRIYGAIERLRNKLREYYGTDNQGVPA